MTTPEPQPQHHDPPTGRNPRVSAQIRRWVIPFATVGAVVLLIAIIASLSSGPSVDEDLDNVALQMVDAERYCQDEVEARLRAPATAAFDDATVAGTGPFTVTGSVDSENGFGALLRSTYSCTVALVGGSWDLQKISVD